MCNDFLAFYCDFDSCKGVGNNVAMSTLNVYYALQNVVLCNEVTTDKSLAGSSVNHYVFAVDTIDGSPLVGSLLPFICDDCRGSATE